MKRTGWVLGCLCVLLIGLSSITSAQLTWDPKECMGIDEIMPGMQGYGKTVFQGTKVETFDIEVIGVLKKLDFGFDMILIKVTSGPVVEKKLQTVSGMSGSPIYIDDRLIGAYAYGWDFQQEAIAGVTPIAAMLDSVQPGAVTPPLVGELAPKKGVLRIGDRLISRVKVAPTHNDAAVLHAKADPSTMVLCPVATPLFTNGMADAAIAPLQKALGAHNLQVLPGPGEMDGPAPKMEAGSAVAISLMEGDVNLSAVGTVTYIKGDTVLAFGHPFMGAGNIDMPMSVAYVHGIVNSAMSSFKLAAPIGRAGSFVADRQFAVKGTIGRDAVTVPVGLSLKDPSRQISRRYAAEMIRHPQYTPLLLFMYVLYGGASQLGDIMADEGTFTARTVLSTDKFGDLEQRMVVSPQASGEMFPMMNFYLLSAMLMQNPYEPVNVTKAYIDLQYAPERNIGVIEKVMPDRAVARPGDTLSLAVNVRPYGKPVETHTVKVNIPQYTADPALIVAVVGGVNGLMVKPLVAPIPTPDEGVQGIVRWFTQDNTPANSLVTATVYPTPSYGYRGKMVRDLPLPVLDVLRFAELGGAVRRANLGGPGQGENGDEGDPMAGARPTTYLTVTDMPYVLSGGQLVMLPIETEEQAVQSRVGEFEFGMPSPVLSASLLPGQADGPDPDEGPGDKGYLSAMAGIMTMQQRAQFAILRDSLTRPGQQRTTLRLPQLRLPNVAVTQPLSYRFGMPYRTQTNVTPEPGMGEDDMDEDMPDEDEADSEEASDEENVLLTKKQANWGLTERKDFLRGKHLGSSVTSKGTLALVPSVRTVYNSKDLIPWKMVTTAQGTFIAGWNTPSVIKLTADGKGETIYPKAGTTVKTEAVTALAAEKNGNLLVACWPDQRVCQLTPDGTVARDWQLPGTMIWDLAVASDGTRYAACDGGAVYILRDATDVPLQVGCMAPDKHAYTLAPGADGSIYLATWPRGKVYKLHANGKLEAIFEPRGAVTSMTTDADGNLYVGTSPTCRVYRVAPNGTATQIMAGLGRGNRHVLALAVVGSDLYAATGPVGGIYRIARPMAPKPEVTAIFAREDTRAGMEENGAVGPESVMVNAFSVTATGELLAAASAPSQVLKLEPRTKGSFLSAVLQTPTVARWGHVDVHTVVGEGQEVVIESRSGYTALPDATWTTWTPVKDEGELTTPPATFAQFRVRMTASPAGSPTLDFVKVYYQSINQAPLLKIEEPKTGVYWKGKKEIRWEAMDPDDDELVYTVFLSKDAGKSWNQLRQTSDEETPNPEKKGANGKEPKAGGEKPAPAPAKADGEIREKMIPWDTTSSPDGVYRIKVVATDKYAKPMEAGSVEIITGPFTIDNTAPTTTAKDALLEWEDVASIELADNLTPLVGGKFRIDNGVWTALVAQDGIFNSKRETALLVSPDGPITLEPGKHTVNLQVKDAAGNVLEKTITLNVGKKPGPLTNVLTPPVAPGDTRDFAELLLNTVK